MGVSHGTDTQTMVPNALSAPTPDHGNEVDPCKRDATKGHRSVWVRGAFVRDLESRTYQNTIGERGIWTRTRAAKEYIAGRHAGK
jgi:hypothetical protein